MPYEYKPTQATNIINLSAKMNDRQNNETLNIDANTTGFQLVSVTNADLFNTNALAARLGVEDVCNGIVNATATPTSIFNLETNLPSGTDGTAVSQIVAGNYYDYWGLIIIPTGDTNIFSGSITFRALQSVAPTTASLYDLNVKMMLFELDQTNYPASGISFMAQTITGQLHNIGLSGVANTPPFPQYNPNMGGTLTTQLPVPRAITNTNYVNMGPYTLSGNYYTEYQTVPWKFEAPYMMHSGSVYFLQNFIAETSGTAPRGLEIQAIQHSSVDISPNTSIGEEFFYFGLPANQANAIRSFGGNTKTWLKTHIYQYTTPSYILFENATASNDFASPLVSGTTFNGSLSNEKVALQQIPLVTTQFTGSTMVPNISTDAVEFGTVVSVPSGVWNLYGAYFYATPNDKLGWSSYTRNKQAISADGYNLGYVANFSTIDGFSGTVTNGDYVVTDRTVVATYSGNYVFSDMTNDYSGSNSITGPNYNLQRLYAIFQNPIIVSGNSSRDYLLSFKYFDYQTGGAFTDYSYRNITTGLFAPTTQFQSFIQHGLEQNNTYPSGVYLTNYNNDGQTFITPSGDANYGAPANNDLSCGLIFIPSGNAITSVYDYRFGDNRAQKIIYTQGTDVRAFNLHEPNPANHLTIYSGAVAGNNHKWTHTTIKNNLFSHEYSKTSGVYWDQIYVNPLGGDSMQLHGLRPQFTLTEVSGTGVSGATILPSGTDINIILATQLGTGGIRASEIGHIRTSGISSFIRISGQDIFIPSGVSQYKFDVLPQSTYVFTTESSGSTYYLAQLLSGTNTSFITDNPLPNSGTFPCYIGNVRGPSVSGNIVLSQQVPNVIFNSQDYLTNQINVPKFKKLIVYKNLLIGIGDPENPSRLWYSEQECPNIYGVDTNFYGFIDIDVDNGQVLTGIEIFKDYLIIFKENSTYRAEYTGNAGNPLNVLNLSTTVGNLGIFSTVATDYGVFGLSQYGPVLASYAGVDTIGDEILPFYQSLDHSDLIFSVAIHDRERQQIYWSISSQNLSPDNNTGLTYSYAEKAWTIRQGGMWNAGRPIGDEDNFTLLYTGDVLGQIQKLDSGNTDQDVLFNDSIGTILTRNISLQLETPWLNFGNSMSMKQLRSLRINCDGSDQRLRVDVYFDQDPNNLKYTRYLNMNVPVMNRVVSLSQTCRTVKFVISTVGNPSPVQLNSLQIAFTNLGLRSNI